MEIVKAFIPNNRSAEVMCPHCRNLTRIPTENLQKKYRSRVSCICQNDFIAEVDFRDKYRKPVDLPGHYRITAKEVPAEEDKEVNRPELPHNCQIIDLSRKGIGILVMDGTEIHAGDMVHLDFKLDDPSSTSISQTCKVRHVKESYAGCEILSNNELLGIYLLNQGPID